MAFSIDFNKLTEKATAFAKIGRRPSAKRTAIISYIEEIVETLKSTSLELTNINKCHEAALNGAADWQQYSVGGCSLCYNWDIAQANFTPKMAERALAYNDHTDSMYLLTVQANRLRSAWVCVKQALLAIYPELRA